MMSSKYDWTNPAERHEDFSPGLQLPKFNVNESENASSLRLVCVCP
jgi:hypothetical protein